jgi:glutaminyl-tRNA synthetase
MRLDDTNPSKEEAEYVESILEDVQWIQSGLYDTPVPWDGKVRKTSDYFPFIYECAMALIRSGDAYVDSLSAEEMRVYRGTLTEMGQDSPYRTRTIEECEQLFVEMKEGKYPDGTHVVRAKIDMSSPNINMRDPTLYRIKHESHQETGDTWCIYPMYDFSHPISDALEHITHSLCTLEFEDHRPFYDWTIDKLCQLNMLPQSPSSSSSIPKPQQIEFSRLNIKSTVLSKRKLIQLVQEQHVHGWDDPRLPTLSGLRRRGIPPEAIRLFCERIGISKADSNIEYTVFEDCVRETMDVSCPRAFAILEPLLVTITNLETTDDDLEYEEIFTVDRHPKIPMGQRSIPFKKQLYIERSDFFDLDGPEGTMNNGIVPTGFKRLLPNGGRVRLRYAYVLECHSVLRDPSTNEPIELLCTYIKETRAGVTPDGMEKVGGIIHWVEASTAIPCTINMYDRLFLTEEPGKESGDFLLDINPNSLTINTKAVVEPSVWEDVKAAIESKTTKYLSSLNYQFERNGYFALDKSTANKSNLNFNRVVTLRDTWGMTEKSNDKLSQPQQQRNRGNSRASSNGGVSRDNANNNNNMNNDESIEGIRRVAIRAATILSVEPHPDAENLLVCQVDCGDATLVEKHESTSTDTKPSRTVVAGLAGKIPIDQLMGRKVLAITNLKPAKMRGIESTAMLLAASNGLEGSDEVVELLEVPADIPNGELISLEGKDPSVPDIMLKSKGAIKAWERAKSNLKVNDQGVAIYIDESGSSHRMLTSAGPVRLMTLTNAIIQ